MFVNGVQYPRELLVLNQEDLQVYNKAENGDLEAIETLFKKDPNVFLKKTKSRMSSDEVNLIEIWILKEDIKAIAKILELNPDLIQMLNERGETLIHLAVKYGRLQMVNFLCKQAISMDKKQLIKKGDHAGCTAMHVAVSCNNTAIIEVLYKLESDLISIKDFDNVTPMEAAVLGEKGSALTKLYNLMLQKWGAKNSVFENSYALAKKAKRVTIIQLFDYLNSKQQQPKKDSWKHAKV